MHTHRFIHIHSHSLVQMHTCKHMYTYVHAHVHMCVHTQAYQLLSISKETGSCPLSQGDLEHGCQLFNFLSTPTRAKKLAGKCLSLFDPAKLQLRKQHTLLLSSFFAFFFTGPAAQQLSLQRGWRKENEDDIQVSLLASGSHGAPEATLFNSPGCRL